MAKSSKVVEPEQYEFNLDDLLECLSDKQLNGLKIKVEDEGYVRRNVDPEQGVLLQKLVTNAARSRKTGGK